MTCYCFGCSRARPSNTKSNSRLSLGPFVIQPASGIISIGKKIEIQIECSTGSIPSSYDEVIYLELYSNLHYR